VVVVAGTLAVVVLVWFANQSVVEEASSASMLSKEYFFVRWDEEEEEQQQELETQAYLGLLPTKYARRMDARIASACRRSRTRRRQACPGGGGLSILTWNVFRAFERGAEDLVGSWLEARAFEYVALNELNSLTNDTFSAWASKFGYSRSFLATTNSGFHVGFLARRDESCDMQGQQLLGFVHGVLHVRCGRRHFLVTHLTPFEAYSRRAEVQWIKKKIEDILTSEPNARVALLGDLNSPPVAAPYVVETPWAVEALDDDQRRTQLKRKFLEAGKTLDQSVEKLLLLPEKEQQGQPPLLRDPCVVDHVDLCARSVPTAVGYDASHAFALRLDFVLVSNRWRCACDCAAVVENDLTNVISDHFPLALHLDDKDDDAFFASWGGSSSSRRRTTTTKLPERERRRRERRALTIEPFLAPLDDALKTEGVSRREALLQNDDARRAFGESYRRSDDDYDLDDDEVRRNRTMEPLSARETALACNWTLAIAEEERRAKALAEEVRSRRAAEWRDAEHGLLGMRLRAPWRVVAGETGQDCRTVCEGAGPGTFCLETKSKDKAFTRDCDRLVATFECPFGCHDARGPELPAMVSDVDSFHAGRCLLPIDDATNRRAREQRRQRRPRGSSKQTARRRLLDGAATTRAESRQERRRKRRERRQRRAEEREKATIALNSELAPFALSSAAGQTGDAWCPARHPSTSRLCPCLDVDVVLAEPAASCDDACAATARVCNDAALLNFNSRACALFHRIQGNHTTDRPRDLLNVVWAAEKDKKSNNRTSFFPALPVVFDLPDRDLCAYALKPPPRTLSCAATLPGGQRHRRLCPCSPGRDPGLAREERRRREEQQQQHQK